MLGQSEELLEVLVDLERAKEKERDSRFESEALLEGLRAITVAASADEMFANLLDVLRKALGFDDAFILTASDGNIFNVIATTDPMFRETSWAQGAMFERVLTGSPVALFDVARTPEWETQPLRVKARTKSALHAPLYTLKSMALFVCISKRAGFFNKRHIHLLQRFSPLASHAMIGVEARELTIAQEVLETSRRRLESIIATLPIGLLLFRGEKILTVNRAFERLVGPLDVNMSLSRMLGERGLSQTLVADVLTGNLFPGVECILGASENDARLVKLTLWDGPLYTNASSEERLLVVEDVTERKATEEALRYAAFQAGVAESATSILHNIGNAITGISNRSRRLRNDASGLLEAATMLDKIRLEIIRSDQKNLPKLADAIGEASRAIRAAVTEDIQGSADIIGEGVAHIAEIITIQQGAASPERLATGFCLRRLLEDAVAMQADSLEQLGITLELDLDPELSHLILPRNQFLQAVVNLVKNSCEALQSCNAPATKLITLAARPTTNGRFLLRVTDTGCGMDKSHSARLFSLGYSVKNGGHGYGLHSVANFVQSLNGTIAARSEGTGKGMEVRIELPVCVTRSFQ